MAIVVRPAQLDADGQLIIDFLAKNHTSDSTQARFDWLYRQSPAGEAKAWIASDSDSQATVGVAAAFPRRMYAFGKEELGWVLGDFCIDRQHRSLGPALQLQRACLQQLNSGQPAIYYDFPSGTMAAIYRRLGVQSPLAMMRLSRVLRADHKVERFIRQPQLAQVVSSIVNAGLVVVRRGSCLQNGSVISVHQERCGKEFSELAIIARSAVSICLERSAEYLNWRYLDHPYRRHEVLILRREGRLSACAVVRYEDHNLDLVDLFGDQEAVEELVREIVLIAADRKLHAVTIQLLASHDWVKVFRGLGFYAREKFPVVACFPSSESSVYNHPGWCLMKGDRES